MKCRCETCNGSGRVACEDCDGDGETTFDLLKPVGPWGNHGATLRPFCVAARAVVRQADGLAEIFPQNRDLYQAQLAEVMKQIEAEAAAAVKKEKAA